MHWALEYKSNLTDVIHYLDDFFVCWHTWFNKLSVLILDQFQDLCQLLGVPLSKEKTEGPPTCLSFLGLGIDTVQQSIFVPSDRVVELQEHIMEVQDKKKITLKQLRSLAGFLAFITYALPAGRAFSCRLYGLMSGASKPNHLIRLPRGIQYDLQMWLTFLKEFNGTTTFPSLNWQSDQCFHFYSDSSASHGCGLIFKTAWAFNKWPESWKKSLVTDITLILHC